MLQLNLTRRSALVGALLLAASKSVRSVSATPAPQADDPRFAAIEKRVGGRVGVAALNTANGALLMHRSAERFAMCSTFKWMLAAAALKSAESGRIQLSQSVSYTKAQLLDYAPVAQANLARGFMTVEELCAAAVMQSDNTCANLLLELGNGPAGLTAFLRASGDEITRLDRNEPTLNENAPGDERDSTTPGQAVRTLQKILATEEVLNLANREKLIGWLVACETGLGRLRAGLPTTWRMGDKTGTSAGEHNATNDVAIAWPPGRAPILIACYLSDSTADAAARNAAHSEVGRIVAETWS